MAVPPTFHHQAANNSLCAYYSLVHFLNGGLTEATFLSRAAKFYSAQLDVAQDFAKELARGGNDPAIVGHILQGGANQTQYLSKGDLKWYDRILIALQNRAHFITIVKNDRGEWWNYDSLLFAPEEIGNIDQFVAQNPGRTYFLGR